MQCNWIQKLDKLAKWLNRLPSKPAEMLLLKFLGYIHMS